VRLAAVRTVYFERRPPRRAQTLNVRLDASRCLLIGFGANEEKWGHWYPPSS
jgi:hypothetical protein